VYSGVGTAARRRGWHPAARRASASKAAASGTLKDPAARALPIAIVNLSQAVGISEMQ
jgi:hypothetical protein